jgi:hypothetical protein
MTMWNIRIHTLKSKPLFVRKNQLLTGVLAATFLLKSETARCQLNDSSSFQVDRLGQLKTRTDSTPKPSFKSQILNSPSLVAPINEFRQRAFQNLNSQLKLPVDFKDPILSWGTTIVSSSVDNGAMSAENGQRSTNRSTNASASIDLWSAPFSVGYNSISDWQLSENRLGFNNVNFDRDKFLKQLRDKIEKAYNPEDLFSKSLEKIYEKRDQAVNLIKNDLSNVFKNNEDKFLESVLARANAENISLQGVDQFLNNISKENAAKLLEKQSLFLELKAQEDTGSLSNALSSLNQQINRLTSANERIQRELPELRNKWYKAGVLEIINGFNKEKRALIDKLLSDPNKILEIAREKLKLPGLQKILLNAKSVNIGASGINQTNLNVTNVLLKGLNLEFLKGQRYFAPMLGVQPAIKNFADFSYANFNELPNILTAGLRLGKGDIQGDFSHVSLSVYQPNSNSQFLPGNIQASLPKNLVTTFSKKISFNESHSLLTEISKSTFLFSETQNSGEGRTKELLNPKNLFGNMGLNINYSGEFEKLGLSENLIVRYAGNEYSNLGNYSLSSGSKEISNDLRKNLLKGKLVVNMKMNYREYDFSVDERKWKSLSYTGDIKWRLKKGEFLEIRYQPYQNRRINGFENYVSSKSNRIALRGNVNRKIAKGFTYRNYIEIASSKDQFHDLRADKKNSSQAISLTSLQTLLIGKQTLFVNFTGSHSKQNYGYLFGNSFCSADGGITYSTLKNISLSSSLAYNEVSNMYVQFSVRQSVSAVIGKRLIAEGFVNAGKNLRKLDYLQIPAVSGNVSISYTIK